MKLKALNYVCDRMISEVPEHVSGDVSVEYKSLVFKLTPDEADVLAKVIERA